MGDFISPHHSYCGHKVFFTTSETPHFTIVEIAIEEGWVVYEVKPFGKIYSGVFNDLYSLNGATVVKIIGNARGISKSHKKCVEYKCSEVKIKKLNNNNISKKHYK